MELVLPKINKNIRCIEIKKSYASEVMEITINKNIRCIEMLPLSA